MSKSNWISASVEFLSEQEDSSGNFMVIATREDGSKICEATLPASDFASAITGSYTKANIVIYAQPSADDSKSQKSRKDPKGAVMLSRSTTGCFYLEVEDSESDYIFHVTLSPEEYLQLIRGNVTKVEMRVGKAALVE